MEVGKDPRYLEYFRLFREEKFFEAHEVLEALWRETKGKEREFYQGLIQLAALLVHYQKGNLDGARELFKSASVYLRPYLPNYGGVSINQILTDFEKFLEIWSQNPKTPQLTKPHLPKIAPS